MARPSRADGPGAGLTSGRSSRAEDRRAGPARRPPPRAGLTARGPASAAATSGPGRRGPGPDRRRAHRPRSPRAAQGRRKAAQGRRGPGPDGHGSRPTAHLGAVFEGRGPGPPSSSGRGPGSPRAGLRGPRAGAGPATAAQGRAHGSRPTSGRRGPGPDGPAFEGRGPGPTARLGPFSAGSPRGRRAADVRPEGQRRRPDLGLTSGRSSRAGAGPARAEGRAHGSRPGSGRPRAWA